MAKMKNKKTGEVYDLEGIGIMWYDSHIWEEVND